MSCYHIVAERPFQCSVCHKAFVSQLALSKHKKIHLEVKEFMCVLCNSMFTTQSSLTRHMVTHTTFKPHKCKSCDAHFKSLAELNEHIKQVHLAEPDHCKSRHAHYLNCDSRYSILISSTCSSISIAICSYIGHNQTENDTH